MADELIRFDPTATGLPAELEDEFRKESQENLTGVQARLPKVKMPTGRGKDFTIEIPGDEPLDTKDIAGIIIYQTPANAFWKEKFGGGTAVIPDCASHDGIKPSPQYGDLQSDTCGTCRHNRFGSGVDDKGNKTRGKACRNVKRLVILRPDDPVIPVMLTLPPSSLRAFDDYMISLKKLNRPYWSLVTDFKIVTQKSRDQIEYPMVTPEVKGYMNDLAVIDHVKKIRKDWMAILSELLFSSGEVQEAEETYNTNVGADEKGQPEPAGDIPF